MDDLLPGEREEDDLQMEGDNIEDIPDDEAGGALAGTGPKATDDQTRARQLATRIRGLQTRLKAFRDLLRDVPGTVEDQSLNSLLANMSSAADRGDEDAYGHSEEAALSRLQSLSGSSKDLPEDQRFNCVLCSEHDVDGSMLYCSGAHDGGAVMHFWCAGLMQMPQGSYLSLDRCPAETNQTKPAFNVCYALHASRLATINLAAQIYRRTCPTLAKLATYPRLYRFYEASKGFAKLSMQAISFASLWKHLDVLQMNGFLVCLTARQKSSKQS